MKAITYRAQFTDGEIVELQGFPTGVPGLLVSTCPDWPGFTVVHARSGTLVACEFDSPEAALAAARELGPMTDWTRTGADMAQWSKRHASFVTATRIITRLGGAIYGASRNAPEYRYVDNGVIA